MIKFRTELTAKQLKDLLNYDPLTGIFTWKTTLSNRIKIGEDAGYQRNNGYVRIFINKYPYYAHRLAWLYVHEVWPTNEIDHINNKPEDNRVINLREVNLRQNRQNRAGYGKTTSQKGIYIFRGKYAVRLSLGTYDTLEEAIKIRDKFFNQFQGDFAHISIKEQTNANV